METEQLIKLILGILVFVAVVVGVSMFFREQVIGFFKGISGTAPEIMFLNLIK